MIPRLRLAAFSANRTLRPRRMHFTREQPRLPGEYRVCQINRDRYACSRGPSKRSECTVSLDVPFDQKTPRLREALR